MNFPGQVTCRKPIDGQRDRLLIVMAKAIGALLDMGSHPPRAVTAMKAAELEGALRETLRQFEADLEGRAR